VGDERSAVVAQAAIPDCNAAVPGLAPRLPSQSPKGRQGWRPVFYKEKKRKTNKHGLYGYQNTENLMSDDMGL
jgi:hypothetical protein